MIYLTKIFFLLHNISSLAHLYIPKALKLMNFAPLFT